MIWLPKTEDVLALHYALVSLFADEGDPIDPAGPKGGDALLQSACFRPNTSIGDIEKYPRANEKFAALFHSLVQNHPFHNGNKRTAVVALLMALERNDYTFKANIEDEVLYNLVKAVSNGMMPGDLERRTPDDLTEHLAQWLSENTQKGSVDISDMQIDDFIIMCEERGAQSKLSGGSYVLSFNGHSTRIQRSRRKLPGGAVLGYLKRLGITQVRTGFSLQSFQQAGLGDREQAQILRFLSVLRRLART